MPLTSLVNYKTDNSQQKQRVNEENLVPKPVTNEKLAISSQYTIAPAYNKGDIKLLQNQI